jgi:hypothetical protein
MLSSALRSFARAQRSGRAISAKRGVRQQIQAFFADRLAAFGANPVFACADPVEGHFDLAHFQLPRDAKVLQNLIGFPFHGQIFPIFGVMAVKLGFDPEKAVLQGVKAGLKLVTALCWRFHRSLLGLQQSLLRKTGVGLDANQATQIARITGVVKHIHILKC